MSRFAIVFILISIFPEFSPGQTIATGLTSNGHIELFYIRNDSLYHRKQLSPGFEWSAARTYKSSVRSVFLDKGYDGSLELFYIDRNNDLYHSQLTSADIEWPAGTLFLEDVISLCIIKNNEEYLYLFYIAADHSVRYLKQIETGSGWSAETYFVDYIDKIAAGCNADGRLELFFTQAGDTLKHKYQLSAGGNWSGVNTFSGKAFDISVATNADGRLEVFYIGPDNKLYHKWQVAPSSGWSGVAKFSDEARLVKNGINPDGRIEILFTDNNQVLHHNWQTAPSSGWGNGEQFGWHAVDIEVIQNFDGRLEVFYLGTDGLLYHRWQLEPGMYWSGEYPFTDADPLFTLEDYNILPSFQNSPDWHINDHCFIRDHEGTWHMYGIIYPDPGSGDTSYVNYFGHATAGSVAQIPWVEANPSFYETLESGDVLWAPHIVFNNNLYYMFYCNGGETHSYKICLRTSTDLVDWSDKQILFQDGYQARDPMILYVEEINKWVIYYCATDNPYEGNFVVAYRTSPDLINWGEKQIAYTDLHYGGPYGPTESPFVVKRGSYYYLFIGPRPYDYPSWFENWEHPGYKGTDVYRSTSWNLWKNSGFAGWIDAHAPEIIQDTDGQWYISHCGILQGGLFIRRMYWNDGVNGLETNGTQAGTKDILQNCIPNPFRENAEIHYVSDIGSHICIDIIDLSGLVVAKLVDKFHEPGTYTVDLSRYKNSGNRLNPGMYLCRLIAGNKQEMIKIAVL